MIFNSWVIVSKRKLDVGGNKSPYVSELGGIFF